MGSGSEQGSKWGMWFLRGYPQDLAGASPTAGLDHSVMLLSAQGWGCFLLWPGPGCLPSSFCSSHVL